MFSNKKGALKFYKQLNIYKAAKGRLKYCPVKKVATSYDWYILAKEINGIMVLNSHRYSVTTIKHVWKMRRFFDEQNIKYVEIEAPMGLQDLDRALDWTLEAYAERLVKNKHARKIKLSTEPQLFALAFLHEVGHTYTEAELGAALKQAEEERQFVLTCNKENRKRDRHEKLKYKAAIWAGV